MGCVVYWEYMDGSSGRKAFGGDYEAGRKFALEEFAGQPVRVWYGGEMVQEGFRASDEVSGMF